MDLSLILKNFKKRVICIAAPKRNHPGNVISVISISAPKSRFLKIDDNLQKELIKEIKNTDLNISKNMGYLKD